MSFCEETNVGQWVVRQGLLKTYHFSGPTLVPHLLGIGSSTSAARGGWLHMASDVQAVMQSE